MFSIAAIDGNAIGYASHSMRPLTVGGKEVQAIFGTLKSVYALKEMYPQYTPLVLWDDRAHWRYELYPGYKERRNIDPVSVERKERYKVQVPLIKKGLSLLGVRQVRVPGAEADDLAGHLVNSLPRDGKIMLVTGDQDWLQLVRENVVWFDPIRNHYVDMDSFCEFTNYLDGRQFLDGKALQGDVSDCIKGVGGIGEKGAIEFLDTYGSVDKFFELADSGVLPKKLPLAHARFAKNETPPKLDIPMRDAYLRNRMLMNLIDAKVKDFSAHIEKSEFDEAGFRLFCEKLAFASILRQYESWVRVFGSNV